MPSDAGPTATVRTTLRTDDLESALRLSDAAGWNQTADDWAFFVDRGVLGERDPATGRVVATAATLRYGAFGWISMVLVAADHRHHGLAGRLVEASIGALRAVGAVPVLDATPAGHPVYAAAGFTDGFAFERWERAGPATAAHGPAAGPPVMDDLARLDAAASGLDRGDWWADVARRPGTGAVRDDATGFALVRAGRRAAQLGPVVADDEAAAIGLVERALAETAGARTFIDVPVARRALLGHLAEPIPSYTVAISPGGGEVATSGSLYATADGRVVNDYYPAHSWRYQQTYGIAFTSDGKHLVSVTTGGWVLLADGGGRVMRSRQLAGSRLITVSISSDGKWLATGEDQGAVRLWSVEPLREVAILGRHAARVKSVAFSPDGKSVASAGDDKMIALWDVQRRRLRTRIGTHASPIYSVAFSPDGQRLVSGEHDHSVRLYTRRRTLWGVDLR